MDVPHVRTRLAVHFHDVHIRRISVHPHESICLEARPYVIILLS